MLNSTNGRIDTATKVIKATPKVLYEAYLSPESLIRWLPPDGMTGHVDQFEPHKNGNYQITLTYDDQYKNLGKTSENTDVVKGKFIDLVPNQKIIQTGVFESEDENVGGEIIETWYLEAVKEGTKVMIVCENVPEGISKEDHMIGLQSTLNNLAHFTER